MSVTVETNEAPIALSPAIQKEVVELTAKILGIWKATVQNILLMGRALARLRTILPREQYIHHLNTKLGMSERHSHRLIEVYNRFGNAPSTNVLSSKISVLYLLTASEDLAKVERLAAGEKITIGGKRKSIEEITVKEAMSLKQVTHKKVAEVDDRTVDLRRAENAHREFATAIEIIQDLTKDLIRFKKQNLEIKNVAELKNYITECLECLRQLKSEL